MYVQKVHFSDGHDTAVKPDSTDSTALMCLHQAWLVLSVTGQFSQLNRAKITSAFQFYSILLDCSKALSSLSKKGFFS